MTKGFKQIPRAVWGTLGLLLGTAIGITVCGIVFHHQLWRMLPLYVSLFVMLLNSRANRYGLLVGSLNSLLYALVYWYDGLYGMMVSAVAVSFTLQMITFILWSRKAYGNSTVLRRLTAKGRMLVGAVTLVVTVGGVLLLQRVGASNSLLDSAITSIGIVVTALQLLSYMEYIFINIGSVLLSVVLYVTMIPAEPGQSTFLVYNLYCLVCVVLAAIRIQKLYLEQRAAGLTA